MYYIGTWIVRLTCIPKYELLWETLPSQNRDCNFAKVLSDACTCLSCSTGQDGSFRQSKQVSRRRLLPTNPEDKVPVQDHLGFRV